MASGRKSVYVETSILSFLCAEPSSIQSTLEKQRDTLRWWEMYRSEFDACVSDEVVVEASKGNLEFVRRRIEKADELRLLASVPEDRVFAQALIAEGLVPATAAVDALHMAISVRMKMDLLLTWNLKHLANPQVLPRVYNYLQRNGHHVPAVTTPAALMESL